MGEAEKAQQVGELVLLRLEQQKEVEHLRLKREKISHAYSSFGNPDRWLRDVSMPGKVLLRGPRPEEREYPAYLLNLAELHEFLGQFEAAEAKLAQTNGKLSALGIHS